MTCKYRGCSSLETVNLQEGLLSIGVYAFQNCQSLTSIKIPGSVTSIGNCVFSGCRALESATLGKGLKSIGIELFANCQLLEQVTIENGCAYIPDYTFDNCTGLISVVVPGSISSIGTAAFRNCTSLEAVTIEKGVISINGYDPSYSSASERGAFYNCKSLTSISIPTSVTTIGAYVFRNCSNLESVTLSKGLLTVGTGAFQNCISLSEITIPSTVSSLGSSIFTGCSNLTKAILGKGITSMGTEIFHNCTALEEVTIEKGCAIIPNYTFYGCSSLTNIIVPGSVSSIGMLAFGECRGLENVVIEKGVTSINGYDPSYSSAKERGAFYNCTNLHTLKLPNSITSIAAYAFRNCNLTEVTALMTVLPSMGKDVFMGVPISDATLYVQSTRIKNYMDAEQWKDFGNIVAVPEDPGTKKCATPTIAFENGKLVFSCSTANAQCVSEITCADIGKRTGNSIPLTLTYTISVYATAEGYTNSDVVTENITLPTSLGDMDRDGRITVNDITKLIEEYLDTNGQ